MRRLRRHLSRRNANSLLSELKPSIHVKGGDYKLEQLIERDVVEANGGKVIVGLNVPGKSTTNLIQVICERYKDTNTVNSQ